MKGKTNLHTRTSTFRSSQIDCTDTFSGRTPHKLRQSSINRSLKIAFFLSSSSNLLQGNRGTTQGTLRVVEGKLQQQSTVMIITTGERRTSSCYCCRCLRTSGSVILDFSLFSKQLCGYIHRELLFESLLTHRTVARTRYKQTNLWKSRFPHDTHLPVGQEQVDRERHLPTS